MVRSFWFRSSASRIMEWRKLKPPANERRPSFPHWTRRLAIAATSTRTTGRRIRNGHTASTADRPGGSVGEDYGAGQRIFSDVLVRLVEELERDRHMRQVDIVDLADERDIRGAVARTSAQRGMDLPSSLSPKTTGSADLIAYWPKSRRWKSSIRGRTCIMMRRSSNWLRARPRRR